MYAFTRHENEMWARIDGSGPYSSTVYNIHEEPGRFICTITTYVLMSNDELGLNTFTGRDDANRFITLVKDETGKETRLGLGSDPIAYQRAIFSFVPKFQAPRIWIMSLNFSGPPRSDNRKPISSN